MKGMADLCGGEAGRKKRAVEHIALFLVSSFLLRAFRELRG